MKPATERQHEVLRTIYHHINNHGFAPTLRELGGALGIRSTNGVNDHLTALERKGLIERTEMCSRAIRITTLGGKLLGIELDEGPGSLVLRGSGTIEMGAFGEHKLTLVVTDQAYTMLGNLVDTGLFGVTRADVAERLLYEKLREILSQSRSTT